MQQRILLIQLRQLGDILLTTPCIREIKREFPDFHVSFLSHPMGKLILEDCPYLDEMFFYDGNSRLKELRLARDLRARKFDVVIDFMNNPRSALYSFASGASERVAFKSRRRPAYTTVVEKHKVARYIVEEKFDLLRAAGFSPSDVSLVLPWFDRHTAPMLRHFDAGAQGSGIRFVISPTHRRVDRRWPLERYARLAQHLVRDWAAEVTWLWGPGEEQVIDEVLELSSQTGRKAPVTSFKEMAALMANHDCFIGNSNGPSHVAVAADIYSLQLHGPTNPASWCPLSEKHRALQGVAADGTGDKAMEHIQVSDVVHELEQIQDSLVGAAAKRVRCGPRVNWQKLSG